jgi:hypothetical protein
VRIQALLPVCPEYVVSPHMQNVSYEHCRIFTCQIADTLIEVHNCKKTHGLECAEAENVLSS